jgi:lipopolysaccharide transport protein LptA
MAPSCRKAWWPPALALATCIAAAAPVAPTSQPAAPTTQGTAPTAQGTAPTTQGSAPTPAAPRSLLQAGQQPITVDAASSEVDYRTNTVAFSQVVISQGATRVQADHAHATGLNFANSRWTFDGHVRIDAEQHGSLRSDQAIVEFHENRIARATINGKPAQFEQRRAESEQTARGHADEIVYDVNEGTVRLANDAWLSDGQNEISGPLLVYNVRGQRVQADASPGGERVHITISPRAAPPAGADAAKPPPEPAHPAPSPQP